MWEGLNHKRQVFKEMPPKANMKKRSSERGGKQLSPLLINVCSIKCSKCSGGLPAVVLNPEPVIPLPGNLLPPVRAGSGWCYSHLHFTGPLLGPHKMENLCGV